MKMLTIVCREKYEDDVLVLFSNLGVKGYTVMSGAGVVAKRVLSLGNSAGEIATCCSWSPSTMIRWHHW